MIVGFIGLGTMGGPMAANVLKGGHRLVVSDVESAAVAKLTAKGATAASTPREVAAASEIVVTMLPDAPDVERVALGADGIVAGIRAGSVYVDMSTIDPATTRKIGAAVAARGAAMIDSPVGKTADHAVAGLARSIGHFAAASRQQNGHRLRKHKPPLTNRTHEPPLMLCAASGRARPAANR